MTSPYDTRESLRQPRFQLTQAELESLCNRGLTDMDIAEQIGMSAATVANYRLKWSIKGDSGQRRDRSLPSLHKRLSERELRRLYHEEFLTDEKIARRLGAATGQVSSLRRKYGIRTLKRWERYRLPPLEGDLRSMFIGSMLGDASLSHKDTAVVLQESHCLEQKSYLEWKISLWGSWVVAYSPEVPNGRSRNGDQHWSCVFHTRPHGDLIPWREKFYWRGEKDRGGNTRKCTPVEVIDELTPLALAVWYMDDGTNGHWPSLCYGQHPGCREVAIEALLKMGLESTWTPAKKKGQELRRGQLVFRGHENADRFFDLVDPYMQECLSYKFERKYAKSRNYRRKTILTAEFLGDRLASGDTFKDIASATGFSPGVVSDQARRLGVTREFRGISDVQVERVLSLVESGLPNQDIMSDTGLGYSTLSRILRVHNINRRFSSPPPDLAERVAAGESVEAIAHSLDMCPKTIRRHVEEQGIEYEFVRPKRKQETIDPDRLREAVEDGLSLQEMGELFGCSWSTVQLRLRALGLRSKKKGGPPKGRKRVKIDVEAVRSRLESGEDLKTIATDLGVHLATLRRHLKRHPREATP